MTKLLVSVVNAAEARTALDAGADLIDVKDPTRGSLGAPDLATIRSVVAEVAKAAPVSVALGELSELSVLDSLAMISGVDFAKLGMAGLVRQADWSGRWSDR